MRDISWFCDTEDSRYALTTPWVKDGWQYATNGHIAVRQPAPEQPNTDDVKKRPKHIAKDLFPPASCTEPWPVPTGLKTEPLADDDSLHDPRWAISAANTEIAGRLIAGCYVLLISLLGNVRYDPRGKPHDPLRFSADGIEGTVMPLESRNT